MRGFRNGLLLLLLAVSAPLMAIEPPEEYGKKVQSGQNVPAYDTGLFGDSTSLSSGATEFSVTDVSLPGNNALPVAFGRHRSIENAGQMLQYAMADWDMNVPFIEGVFSESRGWTVAGTGDVALPTRCSTPGAPPNAMSLTPRGDPSVPVAARDYWQGIHMYVPSQGTQELLYLGKFPSSNAPSPFPKVTLPSDRQSYPNEPNYRWVTTNQWFFSCESGSDGEGFRARSPDGLIYHFTVMVTLPHAELLWPVPDASGGQAAIVARKKMRLYPSKVEDRFGNSVFYTWTDTVAGNLRSRELLSIKSNEVPAREISLTHNGPNGTIDSVSVRDGGALVRTWQYGYYLASESNLRQLKSVVLPDNSAWTLDFNAIGWGRINVDPHTDITGYETMQCNWMRKLTNNVSDVTITHPSGAKGVFTFDVLRQGRSNVVVDCTNVTETDKRKHVTELPARYDVWALKNKKISGPGLPSIGYSWAYAYTPVYGSYQGQANNPCNPGCPVKSVRVTEPDGNFAVHTFGTEYNVNENQLQMVQSYSGGSLARTESYTYVTESEIGAEAFPDQMGESPQDFGPGDSAARDATNSYLSTHLRPQRERKINQAGVNFTAHVTGYDNFAHPTKVTKSSDYLKGGVPSTLGTKYETLLFQNDLNAWVIGLPKSLTVSLSISGGGSVVSQTDYNVKSLPDTTWSFGKRQQVFGYDNFGALTSAKDGNDKVTRFADYLRGVPRTVTYPTLPETWQSATVNNFGDITSITDELGNISNYDYNGAGGRLSTIRYPTGDTVAWHNTNFSLVQTAADGCVFSVTKYCAGGLAGGHWEQTVRTAPAGAQPTDVTQQKTTYFDALWRPVVTLEEDTGRPSTRRYTVRRFDHAGREVFASYPLSVMPTSLDSVTSGIRHTYDGIGRLTSTTQDSESVTTSQGTQTTTLTTLFTYSNPFQKWVTNPRGKVTKLSYQAFDEPREDAPTKIEAPETLLIEIPRDLFGAPTSITRSGTQDSNGTARAVTLQRLFVYDSNHLLCHTVDPEIGATVQGYDGADNVVWVSAGVPLANPNVCNRNDTAINNYKSVRTFDQRNRPLDTTFADNSPAISRTYYPDGQLKTITSGTSIWTYGYNKRRLLTSESLQISGLATPYVLGNDYDAFGHLSKLTYPDGVQVDYAPTALGDPTKAGNYVFSVSTYPNGGIDSFSYGNGITHKTTQNARGLPSESKDVGVIDDVYTYDENANVKRIYDQLANATTRDMTYDDLDRLETAGGPNSSFGYASFTYDALDNVRTSMVGSRGYTHTYNASFNQLSTLMPVGAATRVDYTYSHGNLSTRKVGTTTQNFTFDHANRLRSTSGTAASENESYAYDGHGRRMTVTRNADNTHRYMAYSMSGQLRYELDDKTGVGTDYIYLGGSLVAREDAGAITTPAAPTCTAVDTPTPTLNAGATTQRINVHGVTNATGVLFPTWSDVNGQDDIRWEVGVNDGGGNWHVDLNLSLYMLNNPQYGTYSTHVYLRPSSGSDVFCGAQGWTRPAGGGGGTAPITPGISAGPTPNTDGNFSVSWSNVSNATSYTLEWNANNTAWVQRYQGSGLGISETALAPGLYKYHITACNSIGCSAPSADALVRVDTSAGTAPLPVSSFIASPANSTDGSYTLTWTLSAGATQYNLYERINGGEWLLAYPNNQSVPVTQSPATFSGRGNGTYEYKISACNGSIATNNFACSAEVFANTAVTVAIPGGLQPPAGITSDAIGCSTALNRTFTLSWNAVSGATSYIVHEIQGDGGIDHDLPATTATTMQLTRNTNVNGQSLTTLTYDYMVKACNGTGCSNWTVTTSVCIGTDMLKKEQAESAMTTAHASALAAGSTVTYLHTDGLGSLVAQTNSTATVTKRLKYEPYGAPTDATYTDGPGYAGHVTDAATKLTYMQQRYYDPIAGRFLSMDPVAVDLKQAGNFNRYWYADNNPYKHIDPDGRQIDDPRSSFLNSISLLSAKEESIVSAVAKDAVNSIKSAPEQTLNEAKTAATDAASAVGSAAARAIPDYVHASGGTYVATGGLAYTRNGTFFAGGGVAHGTPQDVVSGKWGGSIALGYILKRTSGADVDSIVGGTSSSFGGCYYACFVYSITTGASAIEIGFGTPGISLQPVEYLEPVKGDLPGWNK